MSVDLSPIDLGYLDAAAAGLLAERLGQPLQPWQQRIIDAEMIRRRLREHRAQQDAGSADGILLLLAFVALEIVIVGVRWGWVGLAWLLAIHVACVFAFVLLILCSSDEPVRTWRDRRRS